MESSGFSPLSPILSASLTADRNKGVVIIVGDDEDDGTVQPVADAQQQPSLIAIVREIRPGGGHSAVRGGRGLSQ